MHILISVLYLLEHCSAYLGFFFKGKNQIIFHNFYAHYTLEDSFLRILRYIFFKIFSASIPASRTPTLATPTLSKGSLPFFVDRERYYKLCLHEFNADSYLQLPVLLNLLHSICIMEITSSTVMECKQNQ